MSIRFKVCCIKSIAEARLAIDAGASALGLVGKMPSGPGVVEDGIAREIAQFCPPGISTFMLTSETETDAILAHWQKVQASVVQLTDYVDEAIYVQLREALPGIKLVQVVHITDMASVEYGLSMQQHLDGFLLDSGNTSLAVKELGGTGRVHDWPLSARFVASTHLPVYLAGGITAANVRKAIETVKPFGIDLCSGVRKDDVLDEAKLGAFSKVIHEYKGMKHHLEK